MSQNELATTTGGGTMYGNWQYPHVEYRTNQWPTVWAWAYPPEPQECIGKAHVFACDHEPTCQCGKVQRVMPKAKR